MKAFLALKPVTLAAILLTIYSCGDDDQPIDCGTSGLSTSASNIVDATCGLDNGSFGLAVSGGASPFEFSVAGSDFQSLAPGTSTIEGVPSGNHTVTVRDGNNCTATVGVNLSNVNNVAIDTQIEASGCMTSNGTITIEASGGNEPYTYSLDGGASQVENIFSGLVTGDYTALVTDNDGCQTSVTVSVLSGVSYNNEIMALITANCAISNCHDGSNNSIPNWTVLTTVQANATNIKSLTSDQRMPPDGRPDLEPSEIQAIACWVDDGALNN